MPKINYSLTIGTWCINSANDSRTEFIELETSQSIDSPTEICKITLYAPPNPKAGSLERAAGAAAESLELAGGSGAEEGFSVQIRGSEVKYGDQITIELTSGDISDKAMTAEVASISSSFEKTVIIGRTGMQKLANTRLSQVYENQTLSQMIKDLASQTGINVGTIEAGNTYSYFIVHESKNLLRHIRELAMREGMDVYFDSDNKLTIKKFNKSSADHTFYYGIDILELQVFSHQMTSDRVLVCGESPASSLGSDTWHWLVKDISPFRGDTGDGGNTSTIQDYAIKTKDAADNLSASKFNAIRDHSTWGRLKILGNPKVKLGDAIEIKNVPKSELNGLFKVTSIRHVLNKQEGYLTFIDFVGLGGTKESERPS